MNKGFPGGPDGKESICNTGDPGSIPGSGRSPGEGNGYPRQYSCLENSIRHSNVRYASAADSRSLFPDTLFQRVSCPYPPLIGGVSRGNGVHASIQKRKLSIYGKEVSLQHFWRGEGIIAFLLLELEFAYEIPWVLVHMQIVIQKVWG